MHKVYHQAKIKSVRSSDDIDNESGSPLVIIQMVIVIVATKKIMDFIIECIPSQ